MTTRIKRIVPYGWAALFVAAWIAWLIPQVAPQAPSTPGIAYVGLTNSSNGILAHFRITNSVAYRGYLGVAPVEVDYGSGWPISRFPVGIGLFEIPWGSVTNIFIVIPAPEKAWRLPVAYAMEQSRLESFVRMVTDFVWDMPTWNSNTARLYTTYSYRYPIQP